MSYLMLGFYGDGHIKESNYILPQEADDEGTWQRKPTEAQGLFPGTKAASTKPSKPPLPQ